jgi:hypothetical protein
MVTALLVTLISYLLVYLAPARSNLSDSPKGTPPLAALATATTAATATVAPNASDTPTGSGSGAHPTPGFTVQSITTASVDMSTDSGFLGMNIDSSAPIPTAVGGCGPHVMVYVIFTINLSNNPTPPNRHEGNTAPINYYIRNSDGSGVGSVAHPLVEQIPGAGTVMTLRTNWQMSYTQASGSSQWTELDIVQPNQMSYQATYKALCAFTVATPHVSVSSISYNCATGGDQTFTLTGTLKASFTSDNTSHTVTYIWDNEFSTHGTTTPTQTVTFPPGVTSMPAQPETIMGNAANQTAAFHANLRVNYGETQMYSGVTVTSAC